MTHRVVIWGTGNVGRPAIRAAAAHRDLELVGVVVSNPDKVGRDAGDLAGIGPLGVAATDDPAIALDPAVDAVIYTASGDFRPDEAQRDLEACLAAGVNVVSTSFYGLLHPGSVPDDLRSSVSDACRARQQLGLRVRHRSRLGHRHPSAPRVRRVRRHRRDPDPGALQLRALRPARGGPHHHRVRPADGPAATDAARLRARDGVGPDDPHAGRRPRRRAGRDHDPRRTPTSRAHHRRSGDGDLRRGNAGSLPLRGARHRGAVALCWWSSTSRASTTTAPPTGPSPRRARVCIASSSRATRT